MLGGLTLSFATYLVTSVSLCNYSRDLRVCLSICLSVSAYVYVLRTLVSFAKMTEPIEMRFGDILMLSLETFC